jgi:hypothetical protein
MQRIAVGGKFIVTVKNSDGIFIHFIREPFPVLNK